VHTCFVVSATAPGSTLPAVGPPTSLSLWITKDRVHVTGAAIVARRGKAEMIASDRGRIFRWLAPLPQLGVPLSRTIPDPPSVAPWNDRRRLTSKALNVYSVGRKLPPF
jgi:hypothetical protein